ncbi:ERAD-associated protein [Podila epicladia]|nr:ERAD-associated protein [Podila epicladia]
MMYSRGAGGLAVDQAKAKECFLTAAGQNYPDAQVNLALILLHDPKTHHQAFKLFEEAAAKGQNFQAIYNLGEMHHYGLGASKSCPHAATYYKYVAERGGWDDPLFTHSYDAYQAGDVEYAAMGYLQAAERGIEVGQSNFAWILDRELPTARYLTSLTSPSRTALVALADSALAALGTPSRLLEMALVYWTRSANQGDVDARVKMGDYYFAGIGAEADVTKAHACYKVAADHFSAMAMWNLGWMHENGIGVTKDFHRAKYWYDRSLEMNPKAALPVNLSLFKLNLRYIWNYLTGGETGGGESTGSFWSNHGGESAPPPPNDKLSDEDSSVLDDSESGSQSDQGKNTWDVDEIGKSEIEKWKAQKQVGPDEEGLGGDDRFPQDGDGQGIPDEDDMVEGIVIIGLCMVVGYLMYIRQFRFANNNNQNNQNNQNNNNQRNQNNNPPADVAVIGKATRRLPEPESPHKKPRLSIIPTPLTTDHLIQQAMDLLSSSQQDLEGAFDLLGQVSVATLEHELQVVKIHLRKSLLDMKRSQLAFEESCLLSSLKVKQKQDQNVDIGGPSGGRNGIMAVNNTVNGDQEVEDSNNNNNFDMTVRSTCESHRNSTP